ncbi:MAG TPA: class I SAM-dependent methyltransferase [Spirochaetia bacterium]|nr:class I SAM-dependent methyltransferase [Spirochaetia bacterium]
MNISHFYDQQSSKDHYRLIDRRNILYPKFPRSLFAFENRFLVVTSEIEKAIKAINRKVSVLDIGCGDGIYEKLLSQECFEDSNFIGVDFSKKQLSKAKQYFNKTYCVDLDSQKLPIKNNSIDIVICSEVLEHVFFPEKIISEASRVLKPGGTLIFSTPNVASLQTRLSLFFSGFSPMINYKNNKEHIRFYSLIDIRQLFKEKLIIKKEHGIGSALFDYWNSTFRIFFPRFIQIFGDKYFPKLANGFLIIATKNE